MLTPAAELDAVARVAALESLVGEVEQHLAALADALRERDPLATERHADLLHQALARAVQAFVQAARQGGVPEPIRLRLGRASAQVARQREVLARATAALDRAIDLLMPGSAPQGRVYNAAGMTEPVGRRGSLTA